MLIYLVSELVEFLTNVKAPTATKEEIEKSGLEIIRIEQLGQYERDGKISSNCIERVRALIHYVGPGVLRRCIM